MSPQIWYITIVILLITSLITAHQPPGNIPSALSFAGLFTV